MNICCIADKDSSLGFRLAGVETMEASTQKEALEALQVYRADKQMGIILITEKVMDFLSEELKEKILENPIPLILEIPSRGQIRKKKSAAELLKELVGLGV